MPATQILLITHSQGLHAEQDIWQALFRPPVPEEDVSLPLQDWDVPYVLGRPKSKHSIT